MPWNDGEPLVAEAAAQLQRHRQQDDARRITASLVAGMNLLCDQLYRRVHDDVELHVGQDSMLMPVSQMKGRARAQREIEIFQVVEAAETALAAGYVAEPDAGWFVEWLLRLRLDDAASDAKVAGRLAGYRPQLADQRRLAFSLQLERSLPQARRAPLVVYQLFPLAVRIVTHTAFGAPQRSDEIRRQQLAILPAIADCPTCQANVLENGARCETCGNPIWKYDRLTSPD